MSDSSPKRAFSNHLIKESSPYLLQHAHNPVDWHPWNEATLAKARKENKLLLVSIGYAACHWCHVMEAESFSDPEVAELMNEHFVCIKVDREERPDVDQIYMTAVQILTGRGGWPLNCVAMPDGRPFYGGTYFPRDRWLHFLKQVTDFIRKNPAETEEQANSLAEGIRREDMLTFQTEEKTYTTADLDHIFEVWKPRMDLVKGGMDRAPKFALPAGYRFLLHYYFLTKNEEALTAAEVTLKNMARGGIYDQVGGGFARYSTDADWKVPHFEKMLYDNGQLVSLYAEAGQITADPMYERVVRETLEFVRREMTSPEGGFYSSLDADSEGREGKFYVWDLSEIRSVLGQDADWATAYYGVSEEGNWEGVNILLRPKDHGPATRKQGFSGEEAEEKIREINKKLLAYRNKRIRPALDDKILTSWNGLMLRGYIDAYRAFGEKEFLDAAVQNARFILEKMKRDDGGLHHVYAGGEASVNGFLDDYAFFISALIALYQVTFSPEWLTEALAFTEYVEKHFADPNTGMFFYTSDLDPALIARQKEIPDNVIPSSNSEMAKNLFVLGHYFYREEYIGQAVKMLQLVQTDAMKNGPYYANWDILMSWLARPPYEVAITGTRHKELARRLNERYLPGVFLSGAATPEEAALELLRDKFVSGKNLIYVCQDKVCQRPVESVEEALEQILK